MVLQHHFECHANRQTERRRVELSSLDTLLIEKTFICVIRFTGKDRHIREESFILSPLPRTVSLSHHYPLFNHQFVLAKVFEPELFLKVFLNEGVRLENVVV